ncbi:peptide deformylase [Pleionea sp. CnH1-48]|uniref:peptide deformylase n=1 Tax=Pleionea sp. CnH1-48 TaxID=2954494 RepID=UPI0020970903|nr:peptide deformylase [Pleionea sp. CnH1-48]MCO7224021.1 peptide deformylase [Pleionea sp. CnH1-48]
MAVRPILKMGNPLLLQQAKPVDNFNSPELSELIEDMRDTMAANNGAGLAAPQIGISLQVVMFGIDHNPRYPEAEPVPFTILINPQIEILDNTLEEGWEGCLSIPKMRGLVPRAQKIRYSGFDHQGQPIERMAENFHARVVQHEVDHLWGLLYPSRMTDIRLFGFEDELFPDTKTD